MEETRRHFLRTTAPIVGGILLLNPIDALAAVLRRYHVVAKGDTLSAIAQRYRVTVNQLKLWNGLTKDLIIPGQRIHLRVQYTSLPLTTINKPRINTTKWKNIIAHHSATANGNAKIFDAAHRRRGMENGLAYHFIICNGTNGSASDPLVTLTIISSSLGGGDDEGFLGLPGFPLLLAVPTLAWTARRR